MVNIEPTTEREDEAVPVTARFVEVALVTESWENTEATVVDVALSEETLRVDVEMRELSPENTASWFGVPVALTIKPDDAPPV
jgi:hypothetical protein